MSDFATTLTPIIVLILLGFGLKRASETWQAQFTGRLHVVGFGALQ